MAIPMGPGNTEKQLRMMRDLRSTVLCATSSYALLLAEEIARQGIRDQLYLKKGLIGSERWGKVMRQRIANELGVKLYDIYGLTEVLRAGRRRLLRTRLRHPRLGRLRPLRNHRPENRRSLARRRGRRTGHHHAGQAGRTAHPLSHSRPHQHRPRRLSVRLPAYPHHAAGRTHPTICSRSRA